MTRPFKERSPICADIDEEIASFRDWSLAGVSNPYVFLDATFCRARVFLRPQGRDPPPSPDH